MSTKALGAVQRYPIAWAVLDENGDECEKCEHCGQWFKYDTLKTDSEGIYLCSKDMKALVASERKRGGRGK